MMKHIQHCSIINAVHSYVDLQENRLQSYSTSFFWEGADLICHPPQGVDEDVQVRAVDLTPDEELQVHQHAVLHLPGRSALNVEQFSFKGLEGEGGRGVKPLLSFTNSDPIRTPYILILIFLYIFFSPQIFSQFWRSPSSSRDWGPPRGSGPPCRPWSPTPGPRPRRGARRRDPAPRDTPARSLRASSIRLCLLPPNGALCTAPSVFIGTMCIDICIYMYIYPMYIYICIYIAWLCVSLWYGVWGWMWMSLSAGGGIWRRALHAWTGLCRHLNRLWKS